MLGALCISILCCFANGYGSLVNAYGHLQCSLAWTQVQVCGSLLEQCSAFISPHSVLCPETCASMHVTCRLTPADLLLHMLTPSHILTNPLLLFPFKVSLPLLGYYAELVNAKSHFPHPSAVISVPNWWKRELTYMLMLNIVQCLSKSHERTPVRKQA